MLIMRNVNRLIDDLKNQTKTTVWKHLDAMAANYAVYSTHLNSYSPFLTNNDVYLYCNDTNMVIVCLDCCGHNEENIYEESESLSSLILSDGYEPRTSMIWKLAEAVRLTKIHLQFSKSDMKVYGVLLTEAEILNSYGLDDMWNAHSVMVIDDLTRLKYRKIRVNEDDDLPCKAYVRTVIDASLDLPTVERTIVNTSTSTTEEPKNEGDIDDDDDFARLLDKFLNEGMEIVDEKVPLGDTSEDQQEDEDDIGLDDYPENSVHTDEEIDADIPFLDGEIEQNQNISVKVEILRPIGIRERN